jgi:predicted transcriptional regulator
MGEINIEDIEISSDLMGKVDHLALRHYRDIGDASRLRVIEVALELYFLWQDLMKGGGNEIEEPLATWEFSNNQPAEQLPIEIQDWLFRRR